MKTEVKTDALNHTILRASGFSCPSCVSKIDKQLRGLHGVKDVEVHFASGRIEVDHDPTETTVGDLVSAVKKVGYDAAPSPF